VNVDVATYKAEFLAHYYSGRIRPRHAYAFGLIDRWARLASAMPGLVNWLTQSPFSRGLIKSLAGMTRERAIPTFATQTFRDWFQRRAKSTATGQQRVLLWPDTFNNHFYSDTARAAAEVLDELGFDVVIPKQHLCCGRPLYDYGMLDTAKQYLERILQALQTELAAGTPIVVLEPSCASVFRDELPNLMPEREAGKRLTAQTFLLSEFMLRYASDRLPRLPRRALVQGHCHHKSVLGFDPQRQVFEKMGLQVSQPPSGCCGLAGSFGFEADKYRVSAACGERVIWPAVRGAEEGVLIMADGFSCRTQIEHGTGRRALHLAEVLQLALRPISKHRANRDPEYDIARRRESAVNRSIRRARMGALAGLLTAAVLWRLWRARKRSA